MNKKKSKYIFRSITNRYITYVLLYKRVVQNNEYRKLIIYNDIIKNKEYINKNIKQINISNLTSCVYISKSSSITSPLINKIEEMYQKKIQYNAIYITLEENTYIIFNYDYHKKILLIDITTLNIKEFKSIQECIDNLKDITKNTYMYQIIRIVRRL